MDSEEAARLITDRLAAVPPQRVLVATDFDGTISEIVDDPGRARLLPEAGEAIQRLVRRVLRVAVISGRSDEFLQSQMPFAGVILMGNYGQSRLTHEERQQLHRFNQEAKRLTRGQEGVWLETKPASSSIHFRNRADAGPQLLSSLAPLAESRNLVMRRGRMVLEVMPAQADKGEALNQLMEDLRPGGVVFAGDDTGDRAAFEQVRSFTLPHLAVGVASPEVSAITFAACDLVVDGPRAAASFLRCLAEWASR